MDLHRCLLYTSNLRITEQNNAETLRALQSSIKQAVDRCNGLAKEYLQAAKQVSATTLAHRAVQRKYDEGLLSSVSYTHLDVYKRQVSGSDSTFSRFANSIRLLSPSTTTAREADGP